MKQMILVLAIVIGGVMATGPAAAGDFSHYTDEQLKSMGHAMHDAAPDQRSAYREEVRKRFGASFAFDIESGHHDDFREDMDDHHGGNGYGSDHHGENGVYHRYDSRSRSRNGGSGC